MKELKDTIEMMCSDDYKERFKAEYYQLDIRCKKLETLIHKYQRNELNFKPSCPLMILEEQLEDMENYRMGLLARAFVEHIDLEESEEK